MAEDQTFYSSLKFPVTINTHATDAQYSTSCGHLGYSWKKLLSRGETSGLEQSFKVLCITLRGVYLLSVLSLNQALRGLNKFLASPFLQLLQVGCRKTYRDRKQDKR